MRHATANRPARRVKHLSQAARVTGRFAALVGVLTIAAPISLLMLVAAWWGFDVGILRAGNLIALGTGLVLGYGCAVVREVRS